MSFSPAQLVKAADLLHGTVLVTVPHFDDETLGCGGTLAGLADKSKVHVVYATSGRGSENLSLPGVKADPSLDMGEIRRKESLAALEKFGIPPGNARFLGVREYKVAAHLGEVRAKLYAILDELKPDFVLTPFRYDRHTDHVALSRVTRSLAQERRTPVLEYFVYYRWKMLASGDVRACIRPEHLVSVDIRAQSQVKRESLNCFTSQTTLFHPWQVRPVLSAELIDEVSAGPECFLRAAPEAGDSDLFTISPLWIRAVHAIEPVLKRKKDQISFMLRSKKK
jgi:LmbE family N-acetylglucosaminyl deacetylase